METALVSAPIKNATKMSKNLVIYGVLCIFDVFVNQQNMKNTMLLAFLPTLHCEQIRKKSKAQKTEIKGNESPKGQNERK